MSNALESMLAAHVARLRNDIASDAQRLGMSADSFLVLLGRELQPALRDNRAADWRARLRLYGAVDNYEEPLADSDPDSPAGADGLEILRGLPAVAEWVADCAAAWHGCTPDGVDSVTLKRKLATLRVQMSYRKNGTGTLRQEYEHQGKRFLVRCDVVRAELAHADTRALPQLSALDSAS